MAETVEPTINKDVFAYDGSPMTQCISGFGRNLVDLIDETIDADPEEVEIDDLKENIHWHVGELVRWVQYFNEKSQRLAFELKRLAKVPAGPADAASINAIAAKAELPNPQREYLLEAVDGKHGQAAQDAIVMLSRRIDGADARLGRAVTHRPVLDLSSVDGFVVLFSAMGYALGRQSYVPSSVIAAVRLALPSMSTVDRALLARDIRRAEQGGQLGDPNIDAPAWLSLAKELKTQNA